MPDTAARLAELDAAIGPAGLVVQQLAEATPAALIDMLSNWRVTCRPFESSQVPENMHRLMRNRAARDALCERLGQRPADPLVRFNLVLALRYGADEYPPKLERDQRLAQCLRPSLEDVHPWVRGESLLALGVLALPEDEARLRRFLDDNDPALAADARMAVRWFESADRDKDRR